MGRFYKATPGTFVDDKMFDLPFAEMAAVMGGVDKNIDEAHDKGQGIIDQLQSDKLGSDDSEVAARYQYFEDVAQRAAEVMDKNPLDYRKQIGNLRRTSRELSTDMKTGVIGRAQEQYDDFNAIKASLAERKDISQETKDLYEDYLLKVYGSLDFDKKTGNFNKIKDGVLNLKSGILDGNKFIDEIGNKMDYHAKGPGGGVSTGNLRGADGKVVFTSTTNQQERTPERVRMQIEGELEARGYKEEREQFYMIQAAVSGPQYNEQGEIMSPRELAEEDQKNLIERGVNKLAGVKGHRGVTVKGLSSVTGSTKKSNKYNNEIVDNIGSDIVRGRTAKSNHEIKTLIKNGNLKGYSSPQDLVISATTPSTDGRSFKTGFEALNEQNMFIDDKIGYTNWLNANNKGNVLKVNADEGLYNAYNSAEQSQHVNIYYRDGDNKRTQLPFGSAAELVLHNQNEDEDIVWVKATGSYKDDVPTYKRDSQGYLTDKQGNKLETDDGSYTKIPADVAEDYAEKIQMTYKNLPSYNTPGNILKAEPGSLSTSSTNQVNTKGKVSKEEELVHTDQWLAINKRTKLYEFHSIDIISDPSRFPKSKK